MIMDEAIRDFLRAKILDGVCPKYITHEALGRGFTEAVDLAEWSDGQK
jgi:hypothetical protein